MATRNPKDGHASCRLCNDTRLHKGRPCGGCTRTKFARHMEKREMVIEGNGKDETSVPMSSLMPCFDHHARVGLVTIKCWCGRTAEIRMERVNKAGWE